MTRVGGIYIQDFAVVSALGGDKQTTMRNLFAAAPAVVSGHAELNSGRLVPVGRVSALDQGGGATRTNRLTAQCYAPLAAKVAEARERYGAHRLGVVIGTSTSGIGEGGDAIRNAASTGALPQGFTLNAQQLGDTAHFAAQLCGAEGPYYVVSTACTSGARALASAARLIHAGLCDAVVCGGVDSLCALTLEGFSALEALSGAPCNPMSVNRNGLNIGEGAALFLLTREESPWRLAGWSESADGHHMSAPDPAGAGAEAVMRGVLARAGVTARDVDFVHLHGTATQLNDAMEAGVVERVFGLEIPCASTKPLTGHTLGAAGAVQAALCLLAAEHGALPPHVWDGERDPALPHIRLAQVAERASLRRIVSASYAFGGNNAALILEAA